MILGSLVKSAKQPKREIKEERKQGRKGGRRHRRKEGWFLENNELNANIKFHLLHNCQEITVSIFKEKIGVPLIAQW